MLRRVITTDLAQRLPKSNVLSGGTPLTVHPDAEVQVDLQQFERDASGHVSLVGYAALEANGRSSTMDRLRITIPVNDSVVQHQVAAMSDALGQTADIIAARLSR